MTTPIANRRSAGASCAPEEGSSISEVHTVHAGGFYSPGDAKSLDHTDSENNINKPQPRSNRGQSGNIGDISSNLGPYVPQPIERPADHPELDFRPIFLRRATTIILGLLFLFIGLSTGILMYRAGSDGEFHFTDNYVYFTARYIPSIIGTITVILFRSMVDTFLRISPYIAMSNKHPKYDGAKVEDSIGFRYFPQQRFFFQNWRVDMTLFADTLLITASLLIVPSKTALLATKKQNDGWVLTVRSIPAYALIGTYALMALFALAVTIFLWSRQTGLKWDPISIADQLTLFRNSNTLSYFKGLELEHGLRATLVNALEDARFRLGYWQVGPAGDIWYGVGVINIKDSSPLEQIEDLATKEVEPDPNIKDLGTVSIPLLNSKTLIHSQMEDQDIPSSTYQDGSLDPAFDIKTPATQVNTAECIETSNQNFCKCENGNKKCIHYPYRYTPLYTPVNVGVWVIIVGSGIILCLYTVATGQIKNGFSLANTWHKYIPQFSHESSDRGFVTSTNTNQTLLPYDNVLELRSNLLLYAIVFRALPVVFAGFLVGYMSIIDISIGFIQSFVGMHKTPGSASETILLEYFAASPLQVPLDAWGNGHWKVAWFSTLSTISPLFPIFVGGMLTITNTGERVYFEYSIPAFSTVFIFLVVYFFSLFFALPTEKRLLPRQIRSLTDLLAMCYSSRFLWSSAFDISDPKTTKKHMVSRIFIRDDIYLFGVYHGTDGEKHLGFDITEPTSEDSKKIVEWVQPISYGNKWINRLRRRGRHHQQQENPKGTEMDPV